MRAAPTVHLDIGRDPFWTAVSMLLGALVSAALYAWLTSWRETAPALDAGGVLLGTVLGAGLGVRLLAISRGVLVWDGTHWWYAPGGAGAASVQGSLQLMLDLGPWLLLRFAPDCRPWRHAIWLAVGRRAAGPAWTGLRTVVCARGSARDATRVPRL